MKPIKMIISITIPKQDYKLRDLDATLGILISDLKIKSSDSVLMNGRVDLLMMETILFLNLQAVKDILTTQEYLMDMN